MTSRRTKSKWVLGLQYRRRRSQQHQVMTSRPFWGQKLMTSPAAAMAPGRFSGRHWWPTVATLPVGLSRVRRRRTGTAVPGCSSTTDCAAPTTTPTTTARPSERCLLLDTLTGFFLLRDRGSTKTFARSVACSLRVLLENCIERKVTSLFCEFVTL